MGPSAVQPQSMGGVRGERWTHRHTHTPTHRGTYTHMLHLPFSDLLFNQRSFVYPYPSVPVFAGRNSDHGRSKTQTKTETTPDSDCIGEKKLRPLGRENSDHGLSLGCPWGRSSHIKSAQIMLCRVSGFTTGVQPMDGLHLKGLPTSTDAAGGELVIGMRGHP